MSCDHDCDSRDVSAPRVLHSGCQPQLAAQLQGLPRLGDSSELADLDVDNIRRAVLVGDQQGVEVVDHLVQDKGKVRVLPDHEALLVSGAGLLNVHVNVPDCQRYPAGVNILPKWPARGCLT